MAITKYKVIKKNLDAVINYAMNGEKLKWYFSIWYKLFTTNSLFSNDAN